MCCRSWQGAGGISALRHLIKVRVVFILRHLIEVGVIVIIPVRGIGGEGYGWFKYYCGPGTILYASGSISGAIVHPGWASLRSLLPLFGSSGASAVMGKVPFLLTIEALDVLLR